MFKRARWMTVGYLAGIGTSYAAARKVKRAVGQYTPPEVARRSVDRVRDAISEGADTRRSREAELRREFGPRPRVRLVETPATPARTTPGRRRTKR